MKKRDYKLIQSGRLHAYFNNSRRFYIDLSLQQYNTVLETIESVADEHFPYMFKSIIHWHRQ